MPDPEYPPDLNAHLWRTSRNVAGHLRCGILLDRAGGGIERWAQRVLELLSLEPAITVETVYILDAADPSRFTGGGLFRRLNRWSSQSEGPLDRVEIHASASVTFVTFGGIKAQGRARIAAANLDVLIWLESRLLEMDCEGLARFGVWSICCGDPDMPRSDPPYWREIASADSVNTLALEQNAGQGNLRRLAVCHVSTQRGLHFTRNAVEPLRLAGLVLIRNLLNLLDPESTPENVLSKLEVPRTVPSPGNLEVVSLIARQAFQAASIRLTSRGRKAAWFVAVRTNPELFRTRQDRFVPQTFHDVPAPSGSQLADPFVVDDNGRNWLFVEEVPPGAAKAHLSVIELGRDGAFSEPVPVLEKPYHLSYPFVFRDQGEFFMIPETSANHTIELYRATKFPFEWKLHKVLFSNVRAVDTTPLFLDGFWYLLTTSARHGHETFLFWSKALDGDWHYHPCNPICSDIRRARGAGALFRSHGSLIRPAQDCSIRYGYAIALNRVLKISTTEYAEELIEVIYPKWRPGLLGTHTLSSNEGFEAIDGLRYSS